ncbi:MAG: TIGR03084 family metal-binding protein [Actinomycetota bacterium]|nr:TIGR03084 family metal-binding protein [Actinomycetota bacterium]MDA8343272.1 TIGR03084 family metal-binding protein [Actinomycetota bacterium]
MTDLRQIARDLVAEQAVLDRIVAGLSDEQWGTPTPSAGWTVSDQIGHLTYFDGTAVLAMTAPDAFRASAEQLIRADTERDRLTLGRGVAPPDLLARWRANRDRLAEVASALSEDTRVVWYGPSMSAKSFLTARLMEVWAHGQDVVDAVGADRPPSDALRHIAQLGFITRGWSYRNRGLDVPEGEVRVELVSPSGQVWELGPSGAGSSVAGPALDFCLVVTQRRHLDDTRLITTGGPARDWLLKAQAFAGPPTDPPPPRGAHRT